MLIIIKLSEYKFANYDHIVFTLKPSAITAHGPHLGMGRSSFPMASMGRGPILLGCALLIQQMVNLCFNFL